MFIPGYAAFAWLETSAPVEPSDFVVAGLLFLGAFFVLSVAILSRHTAEDMLRIAALEQNGFADDLTGLLNRRYLSLCAPNEVARALRYGVDLSLIMIDIDRFKRVNDRYGHLAGDEVLRALAATIARDVRGSDIAVRYGGEELLVIATDTDIGGALCLAERLRVKIGALPHLVANGEEMHISVSMGVAALRGSDTIDALVKRADDALYRVKRGGRNRVCEEEPFASGILREEDHVTTPMSLTAANF